MPKQIILKKSPFFALILHFENGVLRKEKKSLVSTVVFESAGLEGKVWMEGYLLVIVFGWFGLLFPLIMCIYIAIENIKLLDQICDLVRSSTLAWYES